MRSNSKLSLKKLSVCIGLVAAHALLSQAVAQEVKHFSFGYDQPHSTGYGVAGDIFAAKLSELSKGTFLIDQFPGAQLGQEPQALQKIRTGDIDFIITSTANASTVSPQSGVMSLHYIFRSEDHLMKVLADPGVTKTMRDMFEETVKGAHMLTLATLGLRDLYGKKEIRKVDDLKGVKVRVQATATEDTMFPAYGAQTVHMPFGDVYTALQTGVVEMAENGVNVYQSNKHYEAAPIMSMTEHEANNSVLWISDKLWSSLNAQQKDWVQKAAEEVGRNQPAKAFALEHESQARLEKMGVRFVKDVQKDGFIKVAEPLQNKISKDLGPYAVKILNEIRSIK